MPRLRLISSPVVKSDGFSLTNSTEREEQQERKPHLSPENSYTSVGGQTDIKDPLPQFVKHEESTTIELFYDLFFVANLTTFSDVHEVNSRKTLTSYMGFFCILWFTWCQTSLYDIRFVADSWLERIAKACHLGVMVSLAVVGPNYDTEVKENTEGLAEHSSTSVLQTMALILLASRLVLTFQYLGILFQVRNYRHTKLPLGLITGANFVAAAAYLIIGLAFKKHEHSYRAFYVVAVIEMICNIAISSSWKVLSFKRTHLVERMSLLTLYILGEGVIDVLKSVSKIVEVNSDWSSGTIGLVVASIASIYMLYMLYFDCLNHKHFGSIRQQIWAFAHFPFHVALVLSLSGMSQLEKWYQVVLVGNPFVDEYSQKFEELVPEIFTANSTGDLIERSNQTLSNIALSLNETVATIFDKYSPDYSQKDEWYADIATIQDGYDASDPESSAEWLKAIIDLLQTVLDSVFNQYGFESEKVDKTEAADSSNLIPQVTADFDTISIVFKYFFVAAGMTFVILGFMSLIMDTHRRCSFGTILRFVSHFVVGLALALLAVMKSAGGDGIGFDFASSPWVIPTYTLAIAIVLGFHHIRWGKNDHEVEEIDHMTERAV